MSKDIQWALTYILLRLCAMCGVLLACEPKLF
jgi:hypothetical protein